MADKNVILIFHATAGSGHLIAARALEQSFRIQAPRADIELVDVLELSGRFFRRLYGGGYLDLVRHAPNLMGCLHDNLNRSERSWTNSLRICLQNRFKAPIIRYLRRRRPHLIVNTHFLSAELVAELRQKGQLTCPQVTITTDYEPHRIWVQEPTERYYTATTTGRTFLTTWGVAPERIAVTGIPVRSGFGNTLARDDARRHCHLQPDRPVVLLLCGGFGVGPISQVLRELCAMPADAQIVAITGRNESLCRRLTAQVKGIDRSVHVIGYTEEMSAWMRAADLVVTKPGGLTVAEALACELPLVVVNPIPGHESANSDCLLEHGAAIKVNHVQVVGQRVSELLQDPARLAALRQGTQRLARPDAADHIARDALRLLDHQPV
ncbi:MAG: glycosyltransferase [Planctomycetota bacterium]